MASKDRRQFIPFARQYFVEMRDANISSDEVHGFMNGMLGTNVALEEPNSIAFDKWRQAMQAQGYKETWGVSESRLQEIEQKTQTMLAKEAERLEKAPQVLKDMRAEAPSVPAGELLRQYEEQVNDFLGGD